MSSQEKIVGGDLPAAKHDKIECAPGISLDSDSASCAREMVPAYRDFLKKKDALYKPNMSNKEMLIRLKKLLNVESESGILAHPEFQKVVGSEPVKRVLNFRFKPEGPWNSTALLDNFNIDNLLAQFASDHYRKTTGRKFYHIPFQMIDFDQVRSELSRISIPAVIGAGYDSFGVVLNTDVSTGRGKHWFCLFGDLKHRGTEDDPYIIEYFNSSGNPPRPSVRTWMEKTCRDIMLTLGKHADTHTAAPKQIQTSKTECGVWSVMYIKSRLEGHPPDWFYKNKTTDDDIEAFRRYLFRHEN